MAIQIHTVNWMLLWNNNDGDVNHNDLNCAHCWCCWTMPQQNKSWLDLIDTYNTWSWITVYLCHILGFHSHCMPRCTNLIIRLQAETVRWFLPLQWAQKIVEEIVTSGKIPAPLASSFYNQLNSYRKSFRGLYCYDWVCIPLGTHPQIMSSLSLE